MKELTDDDFFLIEALIEERRNLNRQLRCLTDKAIADKFEISAAKVANIAKNGVAKRDLQPKSGRTDVRFNP